MEVEALGIMAAEVSGFTFENAGPVMRDIYEKVIASHSEVCGDDDAEFNSKLAVLASSRQGLFSKEAPKNYEQCRKDLLFALEISKVNFALESGYNAVLAVQSFWPKAARIVTEAAKRCVIEQQVEAALKLAASKAILFAPVTALVELEKYCEQLEDPNGLDYFEREYIKKVVDGLIKAGEWQKITNLGELVLSVGYTPNYVRAKA